MTGEKHTTLQSYRAPLFIKITERTLVQFSSNSESALCTQSVPGQAAIVSQEEG